MRPYRFQQLLLTSLRERVQLAVFEGGKAMKRMAIASMFLLLPVSSWGGLVPVLDITSGGTADIPLADAVAGWSFHLANPLTISALGIWDEGGRSLSIN